MLEYKIKLKDPLHRIKGAVAHYLQGLTLIFVHS